MKKTTIVTGALGRVGKRTVKHLLAAGHQVIAVDIDSKRARASAKKLGFTDSANRNIEMYWGNICETSLWPKLLEKADTVIHLAAIIPPLVDQNPTLAIAVNQTATETLVRAMENCNGAKRLIFASSMVVAGHEQHLRKPPLNTEEVPRPSDLYGKTKAAAESKIQQSNLNWSILRLGVVVPARLGMADIGSMDAMFDASATGRIEVVHEDDAGLAFANAVNCQEAIGRILFVGGGAQCQSHVLEFYSRFLDCAGIGPLSADSLRPGEAYFYGDWLDTTESQQLLNFQRHTLDDLLASIRRDIGILRIPLKLMSPLFNRVLANRSPYSRKKTLTT